MNESKSGPLDMLAKIAAVLGFLVLLINFVLQVLNLTQNTQGIRVVVFVVFVVYLGTTLWLVFRATHISARWRWASLGVLYVMTILYAGWVGTWIFGPTAPSSTNPAVTNLVEHFDMGTQPEGWQDVIRLDGIWEHPQTLTGLAIPASPGERGTRYDLRLDAGGWLNYVIRYSKPVQADVIVADFYLPKTQEIEANWVGVQATGGQPGPWLARSADEIPLGEWTRMVLDLRGKYDLKDERLSDKPVYIEVFFGVKGSAKLNADIVRAGLDNVAWYRDAGGEDGARLEQRGEGRLLFDFEDDSVGDWQVAGARTVTDTIDVSGERPYRGNASLKWETQLAGGDNKSFLKAVLRRSAPPGACIARVYLPDNAPAGTLVWANLYTYSKSDWQGSAPINLTRGMWNTLVWDTHNVDWAEMKDITLGLQIGAEGGAYKGPIYVDDIQILDR